MQKFHVVDVQIPVVFDQTGKVLSRLRAEGLPLQGQQLSAFATLLRQNYLSGKREHLQQLLQLQPRSVGRDALAKQSFSNSHIKACDGLRCVGKAASDLASKQHVKLNIPQEGAPPI